MGATERKSGLRCSGSRHGDLPGGAGLAFHGLALRPASLRRTCACASSVRCDTGFMPSQSRRAMRILSFLRKLASSPEIACARIQTNGDFPTDSCTRLHVNADFMIDSCVHIHVNIGFSTDCCTRVRMNVNLSTGSCIGVHANGDILTDSCVRIQANWLRATVICVVVLALCDAAGVATIRAYG